MSKNSAKVKAHTGHTGRLRFREAPDEPKKPKPYERKFHDGWYEVTESFPEGGTLVRNVPEAEGFRVFILGNVGGVLIVEVPSDMPSSARNALGQALSERVQHSNVLVVNENIRFMHLKRATPAEEKRLYGTEKEKAAHPASASPGPASDLGTGSLAHGDGDRGDRLGSEVAASRDGDDEAAARSEALPRDP